MPWRSPRPGRGQECSAELLTSESVCWAPVAVHEAPGPAGSPPGHPSAVVVRLAVPGKSSVLLGRLLVVSCHLVTLVRGTVVGTNHCRGIGGKRSMKVWISLCSHVALFTEEILLQSKGMRLFLLISYPVLVSTSVESEGSAESKTALDTDFLFFKLLTWKAFCLQNSNRVSLISAQDYRPLWPYINCEKQSVFALISGLLSPLQNATSNSTVFFKQL